MTRLARLKPDPVPPIHPLPEYLAEGERKARYEDTKRVLQVPWMGVVTMAFAHYPQFYGTLWGGTRDLCMSTSFVDACREVRATAEAGVNALAPPSIVERLRSEGYSDREIDDIRHCNEVFSHGNQPYLLIATLARYLLEIGDIAGTTDNAAPTHAAPTHAGRHAPEVSVPFVLMEAHHADAPTLAVYDDVKQVLGLPFVNTDYRAFARWPSYWALAWSDLRQCARTPEHEAICQTVHDLCVEIVAERLPNPGGLTSDALRAAADQDASLDGVLDVCRLFQWLLPGLVTNVSFLRAQLA